MFKFFDSVQKGKTHKYIKRVLISEKPRKYRYWYKLPTKGVVSKEHMKVGSKFAHGEGEARGHYEVLREVLDHGGKSFPTPIYEVRHDETGEIIVGNVSQISKLIHEGEEIREKADELYSRWEKYYNENLENYLLGKGSEKLMRRSADYFWNIMQAYKGRDAEYKQDMFLDNLVHKFNVLTTDENVKEAIENTKIPEGRDGLTSKTLSKLSEILVDLHNINSSQFMNMTSELRALRYALTDSALDGSRALGDPENRYEDRFVDALLTGMRTLRLPKGRIDRIKKEIRPYLKNPIIVNSLIQNISDARERQLAREMEGRKVDPVEDLYSDENKQKRLDEREKEYTRLEDIFKASKDEFHKQRNDALDKMRSYGSFTDIVDNPIARFLDSKDLKNYLDISPRIKLGSQLSHIYSGVSASLRRSIGDFINPRNLQLTISEEPIGSSTYTSIFNRVNFEISDYFSKLPDQQTKTKLIKKFLSSMGITQNSSFEDLSISYKYLKGLEALGDSRNPVFQANLPSFESVKATAKKVNKQKKKVNDLINAFDASVKASDSDAIAKTKRNLSNYIKRNYNLNYKILKKDYPDSRGLRSMVRTLRTFTFAMEEGRPSGTAVRVPSVAVTKSLGLRIMDDSALQKQYRKLNRIKESTDIAGMYIPSKNSISISKIFKSSYVHEMFHAIDYNIDTSQSYGFNTSVSGVGKFIDRRQVKALTGEFDPATSAKMVELQAFINLLSRPENAITKASVETDAKIKHKFAKEKSYYGTPVEMFARFGESYMKYKQNQQFSKGNGVDVLNDLNKSNLGVENSDVHMNVNSEELFGMIKAFESTAIGKELMETFKKGIPFLALPLLLQTLESKDKGYAIF